jgi:hypothetical protein
VGGDGLAVAATVGAFGQTAADPLDLANVSLALIGMHRDREHSDIGDGSVQEEVIVRLSGSRQTRARGSSVIPRIPCAHAAAR